MKRKTIKTITLLILLLLPLLKAYSSGTVTPVNSGLKPLDITDHLINVTINNGFAKTEVIQSFINQNSVTAEGIYSFLLREKATVAEVTVYKGERELNGEVLEKKQAEKIYEEEKNNGNETSLTTQNDFYSFECRIANIQPGEEIRVRLVYYEPQDIDTGVGRYVYPLQEGETDEAAQSFWTMNTKVKGSFSINLELKSAWPVKDLRLPGFDSIAEKKKLSPNHYQIKLTQQQGSLEKDFVFYYRLEENLPGRVEIVPYKAGKDKDGTFMMVLTPGLDLKPLNQGADYNFILDISGSMQGKIHTLTSAIQKTLKQMNNRDRFRIILFNDRASFLTNGWLNADNANVSKAIQQLSQLKSGGGTNIYAGLSAALSDLDNDRVSSIVLVTDGVTNQGIVEPREFKKLLAKYDIRVFGFLLGNSANWPLMKTICESTGGFYQSVFCQDDIIGQILQAKGKILYESLHQASLSIKGVKVFDLSKEFFGKIYRGQQLIIFGRYSGSGQAEVSLKARLSGEDKEYKTKFHFPETDTDNPEIERLWAIEQVNILKLKEKLGELNSSETEQAITDIGVKYQIVTDNTSMIVLSDETFQQRGISRRNKKRVLLENQAFQQRKTTPVKNYQPTGQTPMFKHHAPSVGSGGAFDPLSIFLIIMGALSTIFLRQKND